MDEVVDVFQVTECLDAVLGALIEEVVREELLLRPPCVEDVGLTLRWVNHFGEVENGILWQEVGRVLRRFL